MAPVYNNKVGIKYHNNYRGIKLLQQLQGYEVANPHYESLEESSRDESEEGCVIFKN